MLPSRLIPLVAAAAAALAVTAPGASAAVDFAPKQDVAVGPGPASIAIADYDEDGKPDLAVANGRSPGNVAVLLGDGRGSFGAPAGFTTGGDNPYSLVAADFNGDGHQDLAVADLLGTSYSSVDTYASVLLGDGAGGFGEAIAFLVAGGLGTPQTIAASDLDGDGRQDLVIGDTRYSTSYYGRVAWRFGDGAGGFPEGDSVAIGPVRSLATADVNGDGRPDVASASSGREDFTGRASVLLGNGTSFGGDIGAWGADAGTGSSSIAVGDLDGDGRLDLAVADYGSNDVSVYRGDGSGAFAAAGTFAAGEGPRSVAIADFDGDGTPDLALANAISRDVAVLSGTGGGAFAAPVRLPAGETTTLSASRTWGDGGRLRAGDLDCNGTPDLVVANDVSDSVSVLMNARAGTTPAGCEAGGAVDADATAKTTQRQKAKRIRVKVRVNALEALTAKASGAIRLGKRSYKLGAQTAQVTAGSTKTLTLRPKRKTDERSLVKALKRGKRAKATLKVRLTDQAAATRTESLRVTLRR